METTTFFLLTTLLLFLETATPFTVDDICHRSVDPDTPESYIHYGTAVVRAIEGNPGDLAFIGAEFVTHYLVKEFPKSSFLKRLDTGIQCAETAYDTVTGFFTLWRGKRSLGADFDHKGKLNVTVIVGEYVLQDIEIDGRIKDLLRQRFDRIEQDPRMLPCDFHKYDLDGDGHVTKDEFHQSVEREGFWRESLLFEVLAKQDTGESSFSEESFKRNAAELHKYMKFSKCGS